MQTIYEFFNSPKFCFGGSNILLMQTYESKTVIDFLSFIKLNYNDENFIKQLSNNKILSVDLKLNSCSICFIKHNFAFLLDLRSIKINPNYKIRDVMNEVGIPYNDSIEKTIIEINNQVERMRYLLNDLHLEFA